MARPPSRVPQQNDALHAGDSSKTISARKPVQSRSRVKFQQLLDATSTLLVDRDFAEVGLYDIAREAKVPAASVYHFFPTKEAAFVALAERCLQRMLLVVDAPIEPHRVAHWADLLRTRADRTVDYYNADAVARKLFLAGNVNLEIRSADLDFVSTQSYISYDWMNKYFYMPYLADAFLKFSVVIAIYDGVWMMSYGRHGSIIKTFADEAHTAAIAYMRTFLPEVVALRPPDEISRRMTGISS